MSLNAKALFHSLLKRAECDLILDIGSRDGIQALAFKEICPNAQVVAIEANPYNVADMKRNVRLCQQVEVRHLTMANSDGTVSFYITDVDYAKPDSEENNRGTSSLIQHPGLRIKECIVVPSLRIDNFIGQYYPGKQSIALWVDVEAAEYSVLEGMESRRHAIALIHVETAVKEMRPGQRCYQDLVTLMDKFGFSPVGNNIGAGSVYGDVVFVNRSRFASHMALVRAGIVRAGLIRRLQGDRIAYYLKRKHPLLYSWGRRVYLARI